MNAQTGFFVSHFAEDDVAALQPQRHSIKKHWLFGIFSRAILKGTRSILFGMMPIASAMATQTTEYTLCREPTLKDVWLEPGDTVKWDPVNAPPDLRKKLGSGSMVVIGVTRVSDDVLFSIDKDGKRDIPRIPYSKTAIAQIVAEDDAGDLFIAPNYFFEKAR